MPRREANASESAQELAHGHASGATDDRSRDLSAGVAKREGDDDDVVEWADHGRNSGMMRTLVFDHRLPKSVIPELLEKPPRDDDPSVLRRSVHRERVDAADRDDCDPIG